MCPNIMALHATKEEIVDWLEVNSDSLAGLLEIVAEFSLAGPTACTARHDDVNYRTEEGNSKRGN